MNLKALLNLNSYEWWRNHRRVVTFGGFLIIFAFWLNPVVQIARNRQRCIDLVKKDFVNGNYEAFESLQRKEGAFLVAFLKCNK
tara:strand:- start:501 stop:752 length:252 start_codon:yes stop_codon:yes gene_type:complete